MKQGLKRKHGYGENAKMAEVMEVDFLETMHRNWLKLLRHVTIILVQLPIKRFCNWMHGFQVMEKTNFSTRYFCFKAFCSFIAW